MQHALLARLVPSAQLLPCVMLARSRRSTCNKTTKLAATPQALIKELVATHLTVQGDRDASSWRDQVSTHARLVMCCLEAMPPVQAPAGRVVSLEHACSLTITDARLLGYKALHSQSPFITVWRLDARGARRAGVALRAAAGVLPDGGAPALAAGPGVRAVPGPLQGGAVGRAGAVVLSAQHSTFTRVSVKLQLPTDQPSTSGQPWTMTLRSLEQG